MEINYLAVVVAALSAFVIGGVWYSPALFQRSWMAANGMSAGSAPQGGEARIFGGAFVLSLLMALNLAAFLGEPDTTALWGATAGALAGVGWVAMGIAVVALFERRPLGYVLVNGGYWSVAMTVMGAILGGWR